MNPIVISTIIGCASFILTIFSAIYLNQRHVDKLMEQMDKRLEEMDKRMEARINENSARLEAKIDVMGAELRSAINSLQKEIVSLRERVDRIEQALFRPVLPPRS